MIVHNGQGVIRGRIVSYAHDTLRPLTTDLQHPGHELGAIVHCINALSWFEKSDLMRVSCEPYTVTCRYLKPKEQATVQVFHDVLCFMTVLGKIPWAESHVSVSRVKHEW